MSAMTRITLRPGVVINRRTAAMLKDAERRLGLPLVIVQGSYNKGISASAGTHDGGGVVDVRSRDFAQDDVLRVVKNLRLVGFAAWYRTKAQGFDPHIHAVAIGDRELSPQARDQVTDYRNGRNGLASNGPDDGPKVVVRVWELVKRIVRVRLAQRDLDAWRKAH